VTSIADKVSHVKRAGQTRDHACHWPNCREQVPPAMWGCRAHWYAIPKALRDRIWRTYKPGQEVRMTPSKEYVAAAAAVQEWIRVNAGKGTVIVHGPMASGKTTHATQLMRLYGCAQLKDGWDGYSLLKAGTLALTNWEPPYTMPAASVFTIREALADLELERP
jgi:hypothetical protein